MISTLAEPFGAESCESEIKLLQDSYQRFYFSHTPFNERAVQLRHYLFVGRRGSGKSSLAHYFTFQPHIRNARCIDLDEPEIYESVLSQIAKTAASTSETALPRIVAVWQHALWSLIFAKYKDYDSEIAAMATVTSPKNNPATFLREILKRLLDKFLSDQQGQLSQQLEDWLRSDSFESAKAKVLSITKNNPVILAIDSLEKYSVHNEPMMRATAALIECASKFNTSYANQGVHIKLFISAEIFPHLSEAEISNSSKYVRNPVYLHWRPKDLMRLVSWRFNEYLASTAEWRQLARSDVDWQSHQDVQQKAWNPYFGKTLSNGNGLPEATFPYLLRHTQLRPRQLVILCNQLAALAIERKEFPYFTSKTIVDAVHQQERHSAEEVLNSYSKVYPNVASIVRALERFPVMFNGNELDRIAPSTASQWPANEYSPYAFRRMLAELGIVGLVRRKNSVSKVIEADFEYAIEDRLSLPVSELCVVHPMFFAKLNIKQPQKAIVYPFPDHPDFHALQNES
ncbi:MAG: hypothetical protein U0939_08735 [Pirellulales bacterium]